MRTVGAQGERGPWLQQDPSTRECLYHCHSTQWAYLQVWRGEEIRIPELASFAALPSPVCGSGPPTMDFIGWVWMGRPAAEWGTRHAR